MWLAVLGGLPEALEGALDVLGTLPDSQEPPCLVGVYLVAKTDGPDGPAYRVEPVAVCPSGVEPMTFAGVLVLEAVRQTCWDGVAAEPMIPERRN